MRGIIIEYKLIVNIETKFDLHQIEDYIKYKLKNSIIANKTVNKIIDQFSILKEFPYIGKNYDSNNIYNRYLIYKKYLIFYEIQENKKLVIVKTIIHSKQNKRMF